MLERASHQIRHGFPRVFALVEHPVHLRDYWHLYLFAKSKLVRALCSAHAFGNHRHSAKDVFELAPTAELEPDVSIARKLAGAGEDEVSHPCQTCERERVTPTLHDEARHLRQTTCNERCTCVGTKAEAVGCASRNRDDILQRTSKLDADDVFSSVGSKELRCKSVLNLLRDARVRPGDRNECGQPCRDFSRK